MSQFTSKEIAIAYLALNGKGKSPEDYLLELIRLEALFSQLLATENLENVLAEKAMDLFLAQSK